MEANPKTAPKTGADYARVLRQFAHDQQMTMKQVSAALGLGSNFLYALENARQPKARTIARIEALIAGRAMPEAVCELTIKVSPDTARRIAAEAKRNRIPVLAFISWALTEVSGEWGA